MSKLTPDSRFAAPAAPVVRWVVTAATRRAYQGRNRVPSVAKVQSGQFQARVIHTRPEQIADLYFLALDGQPVP